MRQLAEAELPPKEAPPRRIGEVLMEQGALTEPDLERALEVQRMNGGRLGDVLRTLGVITDSDRARAIAAMAGLELLEDDAYPSEPLFADRISPRFLEAHMLIPVRQDAAGLTVAMVDPFDEEATSAIGAFSGLTVNRCVGTERDIKGALERLYAEGSSSYDHLADGFRSGEAVDTDDIERLKDLASEAPVIRLVNLLMAEALEARASDIHIEPFEDRLSVRYRIDGLLRDVPAPPPHLAAALVSRIKIMARLDIAERRLAQDGRIRVRLQGKDVDLRISTLPSLHGESVVIRLLERRTSGSDFASLGFSDVNEQGLREVLKLSHGIIVVTGPTGSGKTTTLYASLAELNDPERKIVTVEDPVEYEVPGITQIQVNSDIGLTFAALLRSILRHDPDVIMIGEMRDLETAEIAVRSSLTGHLVLSTLHTNDAPSAVSRMLDMGVPDYLLVSTLTAVVGQRLVRRLCPKCAEPYQASEELAARLGLTQLTADHPPLLYRAKGCRACGGVGFQGRLAIAEFMPMSEPLSATILRRSGSDALRRTAIENGMTTMFEDGLRKCLAGLTTVDDVLRVVRAS